VFESTWGEPVLPDTAALEDWERLLVLRDAAYRAIEGARAAKLLKQPTEAALALAPLGDTERALYARYADALPAYLLASIVTLDGPAPAPGETWGAAVTLSPYARCERCWTHRVTVGQSSEHPTLCDRCVAALPADFVRPSA